MQAKKESVTRRTFLIPRNRTRPLQATTLAMQYAESYLGEQQLQDLLKAANNEKQD